MEKLLFDLCSLGGVSGNEASASEYCAEYLRRYTDDVKIDSFNNVIAVIGNNNADKTILLDAHIDRIGFVVSEIDDNGFIKLEKCGGVDVRTALDSPVVVHGKEDYFGVICCMPPHLSDGNEDKAVSPDKLWVDVGLSADKVMQNVSFGDSVSFFAKPKMLLNNRITASALDNRAGVAAILKAAELISKLEINSRVIILLSSQEETFAAGAKTAPFNYDIDECISVDVSFASQPGIDDQYRNISLGKGPMLCISPILNRDLYETLKSLCEDNSIDYQTEICAGNTGTNSDHIALTKSGVRTALVSIPEKNMHSQAEIVEISDVEETARLISLYVKGGQNV